MEKIKNFLKWIGMDGLLHFLVCYALMTISLLVGIWWALGITILLALVKEAVDFFIQKDNDKKAVFHDLIMDAAGIIYALLYLLLIYWHYARVLGW